MRSRHHWSSSLRKCARALVLRRGIAANDDAGDDLLAPVGVSAADHRRLRHVRMQQQRLLHFARIDVRSAADDEVLRAVDERQIAAGVQPADIAGVQKAMRERARRRLGIPPVAPHHRRPAHQDFADVSGRQLPIVGIGDAKLDPELRRADRREPRIVAATDRIGDGGAVHRGDRHRRFALAVDLREPRPERGERGLGVRHVHRPAAVNDALEAIEPRVADLARGDEPLHHRRRREEGGAIPRRQQRADLRGIEAARLRHDADRAARDMRQQVEPGTVRQRRRVQQRVAGRDRLDARDEGGAHRVEIAVRDLDALGPSGRAARVEQPCRIVRRARGRSPRADGRSRGARSRHRRRRTTRATPVKPSPPDPMSECQCGSAKIQRAPLSSITYASSRAWSFALTGTAMRPAHQQANSASMYAGSLRETSATRSPLARPHAANAPASFATRAASGRVIAPHRRSLRESGPRRPRARAPREQRRDVVVRRRRRHSHPIPSGRGRRTSKV